MTETQLPSSSDPGLFGRAIGVITSPGATFAHVVASPRPAAILLLVSAVIAVAATIPQMTETGRQAILNAQVEMIERFGQTVTDDMYAAMERQANRFAAELLMPAVVCRARAEAFRATYRVCPRTPFAYYLAAELVVSPEAMRYRLRELGVGDE